VPDPILVSIAAALAAKSAGSLFDLVKQRFTGRKEAEAALDTADGAPSGSAAVAQLATHLAAEESKDPAFGAELRQTWGQVNASRGGVVNQVTGNVSGKVVQARDIDGDINF
jgi:hypothetical protein